MPSALPTPTQRAANTIFELQKNFNGELPVNDFLILIRALTRACHRHGGKELELLPVTVPRTQFEVFGSHYKATAKASEAFAVVVYDKTNGEYEFASSGTPDWDESPWLAKIINETMIKTREEERRNDRRYAQG